MTISWGQWYNGFSPEKIDEATLNVIKIKDKILQLHDKVSGIKELQNDKNFNNPNEEECEKDIIKYNSLIDRLIMSKECIKYYYGLDILL
jgi:hypothetical protein